MTANKLTASQIEKGKVYTDGKSAGIRITKIFTRFGSPMVEFETVVGKQFRQRQWTMGTLLKWVKEEVEMPSAVEEAEGVIDSEQTVTNEPILDAEEAASSTEA